MKSTFTLAALVLATASAKNCNRLENFFDRMTGRVESRLERTEARLDSKIEKFVEVFNNTDTNPNLMNDIDAD